MAFLEWRGHDAKRSPQFFARVGPFVLKKWARPYRRFFHVRWGSAILLGIDLARYELEVWVPTRPRRRATPDHTRP